MDKITIKTNNHKRELVSFFALPEKVQEEFDYVKEEEHHQLRFVRYKGEWIDVNDMERFDHARQGINAAPFKEWDWFQGETYSSGILMRWGDRHFETVVLGWYC